MRKMIFIFAVLLLGIVGAGLAHGMDITEQFPTFDSNMVLTTDPMIVVFDQSLNTSTVTNASFYVEKLSDGSAVSGTISFDTTDTTNDTVIFTPTSPWDWAVRYLLNITSAVQSDTADPFSGTIPTGGIFVANIPNDFEIPIYDPADPLAMMVDSAVQMGFNPMEPEAVANPWEIPGVNATGAWKYTKGNPQVIVAIVDDGIRQYEDPDIRHAFYLNAGELPLPNQGGTPCAVYDCNSDGRFDVDDYESDNRMTGSAPYSALDVINTFSDSVDDDSNGLVDDISGWDFLRNVNSALGVSNFPEGTHGHGESELIAMKGNDGVGRLPGMCPECMILPIRTSAGLIYDYNLVAAGARYAGVMGASIINFAGVNYTWSESAHQAFLDAYDDGAITVAASGDEMTFHHWMPAAGEDIISVKTVFPMVPVELFGLLDLGLFGFTETFCTNYGTHTHVSVPARTGCTSDSTGNTSGLLGLLYSYAEEQGITLSANEAKQLLTLTSDDVASHCATIVNLLGACQPGYDQHFGYGRPNLEAAMYALGDPDFGISPTIPPSVRITEPKWWQTIDPSTDPTLDVVGQISSRVTPFDWEVQVAKGNEPLDGQFQTVDSGTSSTPINGLITSISLSQYFSDTWASGEPQNQYTFEATVRIVATYQTKEKATIRGEARKSIGVHIDSDTANGLVPGFPMNMKASGESAPLLYDLDGDMDQRMEIVFGGGDGFLYALKYDETNEAWDDMEGFPVDLSGNDPWVDDGIFASAAVGDLFGDGTPEIVVATTGGKVHALQIDAGGSVSELDGFPLSADTPDNTSAATFGYGNGFIASPILADLDKDGMLEIIAASIDQNVYAWKPKGLSGSAERLSGWPVFCRSDDGNVPPAKVCDGEDIPYQIIGTPAVGILDPDSSDPDISEYPGVVVATTESCNGPLMVQSRVYAIYHNGTDHADSPFLPGWPATPLAPLGDAIPIPLAAGSPASPAIVMTEDGARIAVGSTGWLPQLLEYKNGKIREKTIPVLIALNAVGSATFSSLENDGLMQYVLPLLGALRFDELGFQLLASHIYALDLESPYETKFIGPIEDMPLLVTSSVADLDNDGRREVLAGTGGYLVHAFNPDGEEAAGWPKYTQKWVIAAPAVGDIDSDGLVEVVTHTREGVLYAWESEGDYCQEGTPNSDWWRFHHDERNTGYYGTDTLPPIRVVDLTATQETNGSVTLEFTAPGDDWTCGSAASYDVRYTFESSADLSDPAQFEAATSPGTVPTPGPGGEIQTFVIEADGAEHVAIRAVDEHGNLSFVSNDAEVMPATDDDDDNDDGTDDDDDDNDVDDDDNDTGGKDDDDDDDDDGCCGG